MSPIRPLSLCAVCALLVAASTPPSSAADTVTRVTDLNPGSGHGVPFFNAAVFQGKLYFQGKDDGLSASDLWVYDGVNPPVQVSGGEGVSPFNPVVWDGALWFGGGPSSDTELWRYDEVTPPAEALDLSPAGDGNVRFLFPFGDLLCFNAETSGNGAELVCWNGTSSPTVFDLRTGAFGSDPEWFAVHQGKLYFDAFVDAVGDEPHVYDGLVAPTLVADVNPGTGSSLPSDFVSLGTDLFFNAADGDGQGRVWRYDGVLAPAMLEADFDVEGGTAAWQGSLYSAGISTLGGDALHRWNGSAFQKLSFSPGASALGAGSFTSFAGSLFFVTGSSTGADLYRTCGSGTVSRVTDQFAGSDYVQHGLVVFGGRLYFVARTATHGAELWALDAEEAFFCHGFEDGVTTGWSATAP